ncbi:MAG: DUF4062 domain-containing protein [Chloroflexota bacterium]|nr:DUF4062 domain-containing protein [Chloroflexota bacterium]
MANINLVMISSTSLDLPAHRKQAMDACFSQGMFPSVMEHLYATGDDPVARSLKMVDDADIYIGIFAYRYGTIPAGYSVSITEMEYDRAVKRGIPRLIYIVDPAHPLDDLVIDEDETLIDRIKARLRVDGQIVKTFKSPEDLRAHIITSLSYHRKGDGAFPLNEPTQFASSIQTQMALFNKTIDRLTDDQHEVIKELRYHKRLAVAGCAGSGKTLLAAHKAVSLDRGGIKTLILCHNWYLARYIRHLVEGSGVTVWDFTSWIHNLAGSESTYGDLNERDGWTHYEEPTDDLINIAFDRLMATDERYEAIIVDEGQDFRDSWWTIVDAALRNPDFSILTIFHDDNQKLFPRGAVYPVPASPFMLSKNCRNSGEIFEIVRKLHPQSPETSLALRRLGITRRWVYDDNAESIVEQMTNAIDEALHVLDRTQLVVLTTEPAPPSSSALNDLAFDLTPFWRWQKAVEHFVGIVPDLSDEYLPTPEDIELVCRAARAALPEGVRPPAAIKKLRWRRSGDQMTLVHPSGDHLNWTRTYFLHFFTQPKWADGLPEPERIRLVAGGSADREAIPLFTVSDFKGLEADGVILFVPDRFAGDTTLWEANLYVGLSRARYLLHIVVERTRNRFLRDLLWDVRAHD